VQAKDSQEVLSLHADYVKSQMAALADQAKAISQEVAKSASKAVDEAAPR
jgi:hypothetical protein